jgi:histidinol-phosphatase
MSDVGGSAFGPEWSAGFLRGSEAEVRGWVEGALAWCDATDEIAMRHRHELGITQKPDSTFVTNADTAIERLLRERISDAYPDHGIVGEEYGSETGGAAIRWYIDPIDGTHNYMRGVPIFATLIGIERDGELQGGVISAPALGARWYAWRGGGAWSVAIGSSKAPRRIRTSDITSVADAQVLYASTLDLERSGLAPGFRTLLDQAWRERAFGDFWGYTLVAEAAAEVMVEPDLWPWDAAAPFILVEEAGGRVTDFEGRRSIHNRTFLATNGHLHDEVRATLLGG